MIEKKWNLSYVVSHVYHRMINRKFTRFMPAGHFYSPQPAIAEIKARDKDIFKFRQTFPGIDLNREAQEKRLFHFKRAYYEEVPFGDEPKRGHRYFFGNSPYAYTDGFVLYCMLRYLTPKRVVEVGSGYSTCLFLDVNDLYFGGQLDLTFIEPFPERVFSLIEPEDATNHSFLIQKVQEIPFTLFETLEAGDILFIDSSHVAKTGSDVNYLFFEVLPRLKAGVAVHIHDIHQAFEYDRDDVYQGLAWNEAYLLRAFLQFNQSYEILFYTGFLQNALPDYFRQELPLCRTKGSSFWMRKKA